MFGEKTDGQICGIKNCVHFIYLIFCCWNWKSIQVNTHFFFARLVDDDANRQKCGTIPSRVKLDDDLAPKQLLSDVSGQILGLFCYQFHFNLCCQLDITFE